MTLDLTDLSADANAVLWAIFEFRGADTLRLCLEEGRKGEPVDRPSKFGADTIELHRAVPTKPAPPVKAELVGLWLSGHRGETEMLLHFRSDGTMRQGTREKDQPIRGVEGRYKFDAAAKPMRVEWVEEDLPAKDWKWGFEVRFVDANTIEFGPQLGPNERWLLRRVPLAGWPETRPDLLPAFQKVRAEAEAGDARAQGVLAGWWFDNEQGTGADYAQALQWAKRSADQRHPFGQYVLARLLHDGWATNAAPERAKELFEKCLPQMTKLAEAGDVVAACRLGVMYGKGDGTAKSPEKSHEWLLRAATHNHVPAQVILGGLARSDSKFDEAARWWRKAAEAGNPRAQMNLAVLCSNGQGVEKDTKVAANWARQAIAHNEPTAAVFLYKFSGHNEPVNPREAAKALARAERLLLTQATQGQPSAAFQLGQLYEYFLVLHRISIVG
jgi:TPR repeat protein